jgi:hypothetical protein
MPTGPEGLYSATLRVLDNYLSADHAFVTYAKRLRAHGHLPIHRQSDFHPGLIATFATSFKLASKRCKALLSFGDTPGRTMETLYKALRVLQSQTWAPLSMLSHLWSLDSKGVSEVVHLLAGIPAREGSWSDIAHSSARLLHLAGHR